MTVETHEFSEGVKRELERIYHRRVIRNLTATADYWRGLCFITWAAIVIAVILYLSNGALPHG